MGTKIPLVVLPRSLALNSVPRTPAAKKMHVDGWEPQEQQLAPPEADNATKGPSIQAATDLSKGVTSEPLVPPAGVGPAKDIKGTGEVCIIEDEPSVDEAESSKEIAADPQKDRVSLAYERCHNVSNRGYEAVIYTMVAVYPTARSTEVGLIIVPKLDREDPVYSSAYYSNGVEQRAGMIFPLNIDGPGLVMIKYKTLEEFNQLRGLAARQVVLQVDAVKIQGEFEYDGEVMRYGIVNYQRSPFNVSVGKIEGMQLLHPVLCMSRPQDAVQCCLNLTLLTFSDLTMHTLSVVVSTVPTGTDLLRNPHTPQAIRLTIPALQSYQDWHAQCMQWANVEPEYMVPRQFKPQSPLQPLQPLASHAAELIRQEGRHYGEVPGQSSASQAVVEHQTVAAELHPESSQAVEQQLTPASPERESHPEAHEHEPKVHKASEVLSGCRDPRVGSVRGVYSPVGSLHM